MADNIPAAPPAPNAPPPPTEGDILLSPRGTPIIRDQFGKPFEQKYLNKVTDVWAMRGKFRGKPVSGVYFLYSIASANGFMKKHYYGNAHKYAVGDFDLATTFANSNPNPESDAGFLAHWLHSQGMFAKLFLFGLFAMVYFGIIICLVQQAHVFLQCQKTFNSVNPFCIGTTKVLWFVTNYSAELVAMFFSQIVFGLTLVFVYFANMINGQNRFRRP